MFNDLCLIPTGCSNGDKQCNESFDFKMHSTVIARGPCAGPGPANHSVTALSLSTKDSTRPVLGPNSRAVLQDPCTCLLEVPCLCLHDAKTKSSDSPMSLICSILTLLCPLTVNKSLQDCQDAPASLQSQQGPTARILQSTSKPCLWLIRSSLVQ